MPAAAELVNSSSQAVNIVVANELDISPEMAGRLVNLGQVLTAAEEHASRWGLEGLHTAVARCRVALR